MATRHSAWITATFAATENERMDSGRGNRREAGQLAPISENPASTILDLSATLGIDILTLGATHRSRLESLLKGNVVTEVAKNLPENIQMVIYG